MKKLGRRVRGLVIILVWIEVGSYAVGRVMQRVSLLYHPHDTQLSAYLATRDPDLGWSSAHIARFQRETDATGSRIVPAFPDTHLTACVSVYGDSFAWSDGVDAEHAWSNVLSRRAACRVETYGVGAYGSDQGYLRYARNRHDRSKVVILTHLSENILRNVNRLHNLIAYNERFGLKPRFIVGASGEIELVPVYTPKDEDDLRALIDHPESRLQHEWFAPHGPSGTAELTFPYTLSVVRGFGNFKVRALLHGRSFYSEFYEPHHPSGGLQVTAGIASAFVREARSRSASPLVVVIPLVTDFSYKRTIGTWPYEPLLTELASRHVPFLNVGDRLETELNGGDPCSLYSQCHLAHFNDTGYRLLGDAVYDWLQTHNTI